MTAFEHDGISVIIPCYNMGRFLDESVSSVMAQGHQELQIVVVDDGSTDDTAKCAGRLSNSIEYVWQANRGPAAARNRGIAEARHELVTFLDADDLWPANKLQTQLGQLHEDPTLEFVLGNQQSFALAPGADHGSRAYLFAEPHFVFLVGCGLFRRRVFEKVGSFDENMRYSEDTDWFFRCREAQANYKLTADVTLFYRHHDGGMTHGRGAVDKGFLAAIKKSIDRRRVSGQRDLQWMYGGQFMPKTGAIEPDAGALESPREATDATSSLELDNDTTALRREIVDAGTSREPVARLIGSSSVVEAGPSSRNTVSCLPEDEQSYPGHGVGSEP